MGVLIQKENEAPFGPEAREEENGEQVSPPHSTLGSIWESVVSCPSGVRGGVPAGNGLISADRLCSQQVKQILHLFVPKSGVTRAAQPRGVGDNVLPLLGPAGYRGYRGGGPIKMTFASTADSLYSAKYK